MSLWTSHDEWKKKNYVNISVRILCKETQSVQWSKYCVWILFASFVHSFYVLLICIAKTKDSFFTFLSVINDIQIFILDISWLGISFEPNTSFNNSLVAYLKRKFTAPVKIRSNFERKNFGCTVVNQSEPWTVIKMISFCRLNDRSQNNEG